MREIEFRGKRKDNGEWVYGELQILGNRRTIFGGHEGDNLEKFKLTYEIDPKTAGEYTGLKDKTGKKIFEGDIIKGSLRYGFDEPVDWIGKIIFSSGRFCFSRPTKIGPDVCELYSDRNIEVIGNIWDNFELLKEAGND